MIRGTRNLPAAVALGILLATLTSHARAASSTVSADQFLTPAPSGTLNSQLIQIYQSPSTSFSANGEAVQSERKATLSLWASRHGGGGGTSGGNSGNVNAGNGSDAGRGGDNQGANAGGGNAGGGGNSSNASAGSGGNGGSSAGGSGANAAGGNPGNSAGNGSGAGDSNPSNGGISGSVLNFLGLGSSNANSNNANAGNGSDAGHGGDNQGASAGGGSISNVNGGNGGQGGDSQGANAGGEIAGNGGGNSGNPNSGNGGNGGHSGADPGTNGGHGGGNSGGPNELHIGPGLGTACQSGLGGSCVGLVMNGTEVVPLGSNVTTVDIFLQGDGNRTENPLLLILGIPDLGESDHARLIDALLPGGGLAVIAPSGLYGGNWNGSGLKDDFTSLSPQGVYEFLGLTDHGANSNQFSNWQPADQAVNGFGVGRPTEFDVFVYALNPSTPLSGPNQGLDVNFSTPLPPGTFVVGYGCDSVSGNTCGGKSFFTPFTNTGLTQQGPPAQTPEPSSLILFGTGLLALSRVARRWRSVRK